jgi:hypothetical protein
MRQFFPALRRGAVVTVAVLSFVAAIFLVWSLATRERLGMLNTSDLLGVLALFLLPGATLGAWELDRRASRQAAAEPEREEPGVRVHRPSREMSDPSRHRHRVVQEADEVVGG